MSPRVRQALGLVLLLVAAVLLYWGLRPTAHEVVRQGLPVVLP